MTITRFIKIINQMCEDERRVTRLQIIKACGPKGWTAKQPACQGRPRSRQ